MISKLKIWWGKLTTNEKMMYPIIVLLLIAIATRWQYIAKEAGEAFSSIFK